AWDVPEKERRCRQELSRSIRTQSLPRQPSSAPQSLLPVRDLGISRPNGTTVQAAPETIGYGSGHAYGAKANIPCLPEPRCPLGRCMTAHAISPVPVPASRRLQLRQGGLLLW